MKKMKLNIQLFADGKVVIDTDLNSSGFENGLNKMKSIAKTGFNTIAASAGIVATGLTTAVASGVKSYADLEQNIGGIETLFKEDSEKLIKLANVAYKTAGLSANKYMETVTSFSASLLQSLDGDTALAAEYADNAIIDMADNANKMGTSMEMIQNAYQGFAKQNFTMLDNLKLGYGGTKTEMARLIDDANKVKKANGEMADLSINSFADITEAIYIIQNELGITGTTAKEAEETIAGSMNAAKAAWDNFINGSGDINQFVDTLNIALGNIGKAIVKIAPSITEGLSELVQSLIPQIPSALNTLLPVILESTINIINSLAQVLPEFLTLIQNNSQIFIDGALTIITTLVNTLLNNLPTILQTGITILLELIKGISESIPELIPTIVDCVMQIIAVIIENLPLILDVGIEILFALIDGIINSIPKLVESLPRIIEAIVEALVHGIPTIVAQAPRIIMSLARGLVTAIPSLVYEIPKIIGAIVNGLLDGLVSIKDVGANMIKGMWEGMNDTFNWLMNKIKNFASSITDGIKSFFGIHSPSTVFRDEVGKYLAQGVGVGFDKELDNVYNDMQRAIDLETGKMIANVQTSGTYQMAMAGTPTFNLLDNTSNTTQLVVSSKVLAEVVNTENKNREVATA